ncbi:uncharacterized protein G2W53_017530 [Senna tora]|uniref:Uncharacterized protein n=1 Tax=Senna tora TaxID=362788 RepID=A0A834TT90_9FABA|nr:uncharacterized protein G2W53_017530 [Senna tora]
MARKLDDPHTLAVMIIGNE